MTILNQQARSQQNLLYAGMCSELQTAFLQGSCYDCQKA